MPMATTPPITATHQGAEGGRLSARSTPVTTADRSLTVGCLRSMYF